MLDSDYTDINHISVKHMRHSLCLLAVIECTIVTEVVEVKLGEIPNISNQILVWGNLI